MWMLLGVALLAVVEASSSSAPSVIFDCNVDGKQWGCNPLLWANGDRKQCANTTNHMGWANWTQYSPCYVLTAGANDKLPLSSYIPDEYIYINLKVTCYGLAYRGLLMYALDADDQKVGQWYLTTEQPAIWTLPWDSIPGHPCENSLMHAAGAIKPYNARFRYKAPSAGNGTIRFRALIKQGDANTGAFFLPAKNLTLTEGASVAPNPYWIKSDVGQSCSTSCGKHGLFCSSAISTLLKNSVAMSAVTNIVPCNLPFLNTTIAAGGYIDPTTEYCYFGSNNTCNVKAAGTQRLCPCTDISSTTSLRPGFFSIFLLPLVFMSNMRVSIFVLLFLVGYSSAHNWINSNSRSLGASTYAPCKPSRSGLPHAQVGPGQAFAIEWMNNHGLYPTWFAIVSANNSDQMIHLNDAVMQDYINLAPASAHQDATSGPYQKFYKRSIANLNSEGGVPSPPHAGFVNGTTTVANFYDSFVNKSDSLFIPRPATGVKTGLATGDFLQLKYKTPELINDARVSYKSAKYPWIEAVYKFEVIGGNFFDTANFYIPGFDGLGRYIVWYSWAGYLDCVDVDYVSTSVVNIYGTPPNVTRWARVDHCLLEGIYYLFDGVSEQLYNDVDHCKTRCLESGTGNCGAVQAAPMTTPTAYNFPHAKDGSNWLYPNMPGNEILFPWNTPYWGPETDTNFSNVAIPANANKTVCYFGKARDYSSTQDQYVISNDPDDPVFYGTCWLLNNDNIFPGYEDSGQTTIHVDWRFGDRCVDCNDVATNAMLNSLPKWTLSDNCRNCDLEPGTPHTFNVPVTYLVAGNSTCDGLDNQWNTMYTPMWQYPNHYSGFTNVNDTVNGCFKNLSPLGRRNWYYSNLHDTTFEECALLVSQDADCGNHFMFERDWFYGCHGCAEKKVNPSSCICYKKEPKCKTCSRVFDYRNSWDIWQLQTIPDPKCSNGTLSADGLHCCSSSCGAGNCTLGYQRNPNVGFCDYYGITRSCDHFEAPCVINNSTV